MSIYFPESEDIYFSKTKEYFQEVISSYSNGNYRSAIVMLYTVAICDMLFKLQELKDMFNDTIAGQILAEVEKCRNENDNKSKSRWEKEFVDNVYKKTDLLDLEAYTNLNHLYDHRNFSAHPALNDSYELITPTKETTVAHIKNILNSILVKPPIFIKNVVNTLTEDLKDKRHLYETEFEKLKLYLNNKYFSKMTLSMKLTVVKAFWKFCFCLPDDEDCNTNMLINRKALRILISGIEHETLDYIKNNQRLFSVATNDRCLLNLTILLSDYPAIYRDLDDDTRLQIDKYLITDTKAKALAWFKYKTAKEHLAYLKSTAFLSLDVNSIKRMTSYYTSIGESSTLIDFFIWYYGESRSYDSADSRFELAIEPFLGRMSAKQFEQIILNTNNNRQIWDRGLARSANNKIMRYAKNVLDNDFDYSKYTRFFFDEKVLNPDEPKEVTGNSDSDID
ncbi:MAG: hypothetical protein IKB88_00195 [Clostridia bacterium]|nr:hypothetical protein [Clostridia bacterium]